MVAMETSSYIDSVNKVKGFQSDSKTCVCSFAKTVTLAKLKGIRQASTTFDL